MPRYLISDEDEFEPLAIVNAENEKEAIRIANENLKVEESFIEHLHDWSTNMSFSEKFYYDEKSQGQSDLPKKEVQRRITEYFKEKPEYAEIYNSHWNAKAPKNVYQMKKFPNEMIEWIYRKELSAGSWVTLQAFNLDEVPVLGERKDETD